MQSFTHFSSEVLKAQTHLPERCPGQGMWKSQSSHPWQAVKQGHNATPVTTGNSYVPLRRRTKRIPLMWRIPKIPEQKIHRLGNESICPFAVFTVSWRSVHLLRGLHAGREMMRVTPVVSPWGCAEESVFGIWFSSAASLSHHCPRHWKTYGLLRQLN